MRKLLYSPGFGAGWTTWQSDPGMKKFMLTYEPIVTFIEGGGSFTHTETEVVFANMEAEADFSGLHPILQQFVVHCQQRFGDWPYLGGAVDLKVAEVPDGVGVQISEYDGSESYITQDQEQEWL